MKSTLIKIYLKLKYKNRLKLSNNITFSAMPTIVIEGGSRIVIKEGVYISALVELRSTKGAELRISENVKLDRLVRIIATNGADITIGSNTKIGIGSVLNGGASISIGSNTLISGYVYAQSSMHDHKAPGDIISNGYKYGAITIGTGSWVGAHVVIHPNVELGDRVVVGSNAVVTHSFDDNSTVVGIPARELDAK